MTKQDKKERVGKRFLAFAETCGRCDQPGELYHGCPFSEEIHDDYLSQCNCCPDCQEQCTI